MSFFFNCPKSAEDCGMKVSGKCGKCSDTPRTDRLEDAYFGNVGDNEWREHARQLERELAEVTRCFDEVFAKWKSLNGASK